MDNTTIFYIGIFVMALFMAGIFYTIKEFQDMYHGREQDRGKDENL